MGRFFFDTHSHDLRLGRSRSTLEATMIHGQRIDLAWDTSRLLFLYLPRMAQRRIRTR